MRNPIAPVITWLLCWVTLTVYSTAQAETTPWHSEARKPGSGVILSSPLNIELNVNEELAETIVLSTAGIRGDIKVTLRTDKGIELISGAKSSEFSQPLPKQLSIPIEIISGTAQKQFLHVLVEEHFSDRSPLARSFAIPVNTNTQNRHAEERQSIIKMPAKIELKRGVSPGNNEL